MSHPVPGFDYTEHPETRRELENTAKKKKAMSKKMSPLGKLKKLIGEHEQLRKHPFNFSKSKGLIDEKINRGNMPPGHYD